MSKIIGSITATPNPLSDWNQTDVKKADYIKNKPDLNTYEFITTDDIDEICGTTIQVASEVTF